MDFLFLNRLIYRKYWNRFAGKKMRYMVVLLCMLSYISASGQKGSGTTAAISADIASGIMDKDMSLDFSHSFSGHWSAYGNISIQIPPMSKDEEEDEHDKLLGDSAIDKEDMFMKTSPEFRIGLRYWTDRFMEGTYIEISCSHQLESETDMAIGYGYAAKICKALGISFGYDMKLLDSLRNGPYGARGITIKLNYLF